MLHVYSRNYVVDVENTVPSTKILRSDSFSYLGVTNIWGVVEEAGIAYPLLTRLLWSVDPRVVGQIGLVRLGI